MSLTKEIIQNLNIAANSINHKTIVDNDLTDILNALNVIMEIKEKISNTNSTTDFYWNEIISELLAVTHSSLSGYTRLGITGLRNIMELLCHAFYYYDHPIELKLSVNENLKAERYVSTLVKDYLFYTTKYIKTFYEKIESEEVNTDSVSNFLKTEYADLCDFVHGRNSTLIKKSNLKIEYSKYQFKIFETHFLKISSLVANMYILRFNDKSNNSILDLSKKINLLNF
jgi:hypothetical protein